MTVSRKTAEAIREHYGHNGHECTVRITRDGLVQRHGSPEPTDRSRDYWHDVSSVTEALHEIGLRDDA